MVNTEYSYIPLLKNTCQSKSYQRKDIANGRKSGMRHLYIGTYSYRNKQINSSLIS